MDQPIVSHHAEVTNTVVSTERVCVQVDAVLANGTPPTSRRPVTFPVTNATLAEAVQIREQGNQSLLF
ncbi:hypothetical protein NP493_64g00005 [Ridgeia piscesae]|uniref:Uncharacterized protein n=1 Tax=Ridgeia piscesae TaxID=27915 RepID=A0AAD9PAF7_RIDPI|nr:hypothetical protein NP493_64g00005 [Ridgeia piscesae]